MNRARRTRGLVPLPYDLPSPFGWLPTIALLLGVIGGIAMGLMAGAGGRNRPSRPFWQAPIRRISSSSRRRPTGPTIPRP